MSTLWNALSRIKSRLVNHQPASVPEPPRDDDRSFLHPDVPVSEKAGHETFTHFVRTTGNITGHRVLEIGSREVTGPSLFRDHFPHATYVGFDYYPGDNVSVVGDAHQLSSYFENQPPFDFVFSTACFEHFAMPWVVAAEIAKVLKVGGLVAVETHFAFSSHERPWHFFHYTDMGLRSLFSPALGFECVEAGMSNPIVGRFSTLASEYLRNRPVTGLYAHVQYVGRKAREVPDFDWRHVSTADVVSNTHYPAPRESMKP